MAIDPFRETEERIVAGGLGAGLVRNADPLTDPNGNVHRLQPVAAPDRLPPPRTSPATAPTGGEFGERLGRWSLITLLAVTVSLTVLFLGVSLTGGPPAAVEHTAAAPEPARPDPVPPPPAPAASAANPASPAAPSAQSPATADAPSPAAPSQSEIGALLSRGTALLDDGDVAAARPLLERAALAGNGEAALRLGQSYDPGYLAGARRHVADGNLGLAIFWYRRARELGNGTAAFLARQLETAARAGWQAGPSEPRGPTRPR